VSGRKPSKNEHRQASKAEAGDALRTSRFWAIRVGLALLGTADQLPRCTNQLNATCTQVRTMTICVSTVASSRSPWRHQIVQASDTHGSSGLPILLPQPDQDLVLQDFATDLGLRLPDRTIRGKVDVILRAVRVKGGLGVVNVGFDLWDVVRRECRGARGQSNRAISSMRMRKELAPLTWFTAGTMSADFNNNSRFSTEKFDTLPDTIPIRSVPTYRSTSPTDPLEVWTRE
jgi:hypothetical protein